MARRNRKDKLTIFKGKSENWFINFRVPETHTQQTLFKGRVIYQKSTGTSSYAEACRIRDEFFKRHQLFGYSLSAKEVYVDRLNRPSSQNEQEWSDHLLPMAIDASLEGEEMPEPYQSAYKGILNQRLQNEQPLKKIDHPFHFSLNDAHEDYISLRRSDLPVKTLAKIDKAHARLLSFIKAEDCPLEDLSTPVIYRYVLFLIDQGLSHSTIRNDLSFLGSMFNHAKRQAKVNPASENPFRNQTIPSTGSLNSFDVQAMPLEHAQGLYTRAKERDIKILILLSHYLGTRISETYNCELQIDTDHDWYADIAVGYSGKTQSATRKIPLPKRAVELLECHWPMTRGHIHWKSPSADALGKKFGRFKSKYFDELGIHHQRVLVDHSFRHSFATYLTNHFGELRSAILTGHKLSNVASTELGRSYFSGTEWGDLKTMMEVIPNIS